MGNADAWFRAFTIVTSTIFGTGGFLAWIRSKDSTNQAKTRLMMGVAYDKITTLGGSYIDRGSVTKDEYEDLYNLFYKPYTDLGGNGVCTRIMNQVERLPFRPHPEHAEIFRNREEGWVNNVRVVSHQNAHSE